MISILEAWSGHPIASPCMYWGLGDPDCLPMHILYSLISPRSSHRHDLFLPGVETTMVLIRSFLSIGPSLWNRLPPPLHSSILSTPLFLFLSPKSYSFLELKWTESASVWHTPWEALYKYLYTIQYNRRSSDCLTMRTKRSSEYLTLRVPRTKRALGGQYFLNIASPRLWNLLQNLCFIKTRIFTFHAC